jgi:hypothetical protein
MMSSGERDRTWLREAAPRTGGAKVIDAGEPPSFDTAW